MQDANDPRGSGGNWALANGHLLAAADASEKLAVVVGCIQQIVRARVDPTSLIGLPIAEAIEEFSGELVARIRAAASAMEMR